MPKILVVNGGWAYYEMFFLRGWSEAKTVDDADAVVFCGGSDVSPHLYGETKHVKTNCNEKRDEEEKEVYLKAVQRELPMMGICRGAQFLHVMNGGKLWQHVNHHAMVGTHSVCDLDGSRIVNVTSTHHQMMRENPPGRVLAICRHATVKERMAGSYVIRETEPTDDIEAMWYEATQCLCFQPHPEHKSGPCQHYFFSLVSDYLGFQSEYKSDS